MPQSSGKLAEKMKWIVTRYPKPPGQLIALGAILSNPDDPETRLNRHDAIEVKSKHLLDESAAIQRVMHAGVSNDDDIILKLTQFLSARLSTSGGRKEDGKTIIDALDVNSKIFLPDKEYMNASMEAPGVQEYIKNCSFSKKLYMIIGVATAKKLHISEVSSKQRSAGVSVTVPYMGGSGLGSTAGGRHKSSQISGSEVDVEQECDFAYRIREFTYWRYRREKVKMKADRDTGALFRTENSHEDYDSYDDSEDDAFEDVPLFNELKEIDYSDDAILVFEV
ncbi:hypothetical protein M441DRAFT_60593 [Trichoderma asperellum CBS 433.97]|uniref:Uncharacterized protein n=1 Tax=Trichoderma asperellum (strain ATCC 204424 / CBS 433.97 / NBRC 101777) TaxID=1042311 RepID=A0A2T3Z0Q5_TRIA4|nr:hypothetical protein M441DRAFT_60593 [Trichoderma asperellum CBS 433.97]PTB38350.1 hypothetical protein M441DRAFT_60593 [Trichoderma asperellum CBS 433.97]